MLKKNPNIIPQDDLFKARLSDIINSNQELVKLSNMIDWDGLEAEFSQFYCMDNGRPGGSIRMMVGLCLLKDIKGLSDEELCTTWQENPYYQHFCGETFFQHCLPVEPPSIGNFRRRIGEAGAQILLAETIKLGLQSGIISNRDLKQVTVDTTVQEKAVHFPTDSSLCNAARESLLTFARKENILLRQSYSRKGKRANFMVNRYSAARQYKRARAKIREVRNYLGRVIRDVERAEGRGESVSAEFSKALDRAKIAYNQTLNPKAKTKIYSWHAPETECIAKGKAHKKYEFGCKASYATITKNNFIVGAMALHGNPHDGHTLEDVLAQIAQLTGVMPKEVQVDLGYRGHKIDEEKSGVKVILARQKRGVNKAQRRRQKRRNAIEPIIGHCKNDRKVGAKNWLKGKVGDKINAIAMAIGFNMRKILKWIFVWLLFCLQNMKNQWALRYQNRVFYG